MLTPQEKRIIQRKLIPEVYQLYLSGKLPALDALWIANLSPESQEASANKVIKATPISPTNGYTKHSNMLQSGTSNRVKHQ